MTIKEARILANMSRAEMSRKLEIPIRTIENWELGKSKCPEWVEKLVVEKVLKLKVDKDGGD